ncbi:hypothetical protein DFH29DRAFT_901495 [Suillus ampliporus]|nr:hypothetical protein DFH29DRAFT_901495 [Suillus ampliporus]
MSRMYLFSAVYGLTAYKSAPEANSDITLAVREAQKLRKGFFCSFSTQELQEIEKVEVFLRGIVAGTNFQNPLIEREPTSYRLSYALYCTPDKVLWEYEEISNVMDEWDMDIDFSFFEDFMTGSLASVLVDRNEPDPLPVGHKQHILDEVIGKHDRCSQCQSDAVQGLDLWGPDNWRYLWRVLTERLPQLKQCVPRAF